MTNMAHQIRKIDYYHLTVQDQPGEAYKVLSYLADLGISMSAFSAIPMGPNSMLLTIFPEDSLKLSKQLKYAGQRLDGPHRALLVQGTDEVGALIDIHMKLYQAGVNVSAASGVTSGKDSFGYVIYIRSDEFEKAVEALGI
jgi:hypothetical protein